MHVLCATAPGVAVLCGLIDRRPANTKAKPKSCFGRGGGGGARDGGIDCILGLRGPWQGRMGRLFGTEAEFVVYFAYTLLRTDTYANISTNTRTRKGEEVCLARCYYVSSRISRNPISPVPAGQEVAIREKKASKPTLKTDFQRQVVRDRPPNPPRQSSLARLQRQKSKRQKGSRSIGHPCAKPDQTAPNVPTGRWGLAWHR